MPSDAETEEAFNQLLHDWYVSKVGRDLSESYAVFNTCRPNKTFCRGPDSVRAGEYLTIKRKNRCNNLLCPACTTWRLGTLLRNVVVSNRVYFGFKQLGWLGPSQPLSKDQIVQWEERNQGRIPGEYHGWAAVMEVSPVKLDAAGYTRVGLWSIDKDLSETPLRHGLGFLETHWYEKPDTGLWVVKHVAQDTDQRLELVSEILDSIEPVESGLTSGVMDFSEYRELVAVHDRNSPQGKASRF